ncbi:hypothetical protein AALA80_17915 [Oscillospiraceae bacterium 50-60]
MEIAAFARKGGYGVLRLLEGPSMGRIQAPKPEVSEAKLQDLEIHFRSIGSYRGKLAPISSGHLWGQGTATGSAIMEGMIDKLPAKLDEMAEMWSPIFH